MRVLTKALSGLSRSNCRRARELAAHVALGPRRGWWQSAEQAVEAFPNQRYLKPLRGSVNWEAILDAIRQIIEAIQEAKQE